MPQSARSSSPEFLIDSEGEALGRARRLLLVFAAIALLLHLAAIFLLPAEWTKSPAPAPVEVREISPSKLDEIRKQWSRPKSLLINPDRDKPKDKTEAPKDARYFSDRNTRVEKEQRARDSAILPRPGAPGAPSEARTEPVPPLAKLGLPLKLEDMPGEPLAAKSRPDSKKESKKDSKKGPKNRASTKGGQDGGQQYVQEKNLPTAGETLLNAQESVFYSFYARLYETIGPLWQSRVNGSRPERPLQPGEYLTAVEIALNAEGNLVEVRALKSSGVQAFDRAIVEAWQKIGRFPNPPKALLDPDGFIRIRGSFIVTVGSQTLFNYSQPEQID